MKRLEDPETSTQLQQSDFGKGSKTNTEGKTNLVQQTGAKETIYPHMKELH